MSGDFIDFIPNPAARLVDIQMPGGSFVTLEEVRMKEAVTTRTALAPFMLKAGDIVAFGYMDDQSPRGFTFEVLAVTATSSIDAVVTGQIEGYDLPEEVQGRDMIINGAGWGSSMMSPGILVTGRCPYFGYPSTRDEYIGPEVTTMEVLRKNPEGEYVSAKGVTRQI